MQHDTKAFERHNRDLAAYDIAPITLRTTPPLGVTPETMRGIMIGLPLAVFLWAIIFFLIWLVL